MTVAHYLYPYAIAELNIARIKILKNDHFLSAEAINRLPSQGIATCIFDVVATFFIYLVLSEIEALLVQPSGYKPKYVVSNIFLWNRRIVAKYFSLLILRKRAI